MYRILAPAPPRRGLVAIRVYGGAGGGGDSEGTISDSENSTTGDPDDFLPAGEGGGAAAGGGTGMDCSYGPKAHEKFVVDE